MITQSDAELNPEEHLGRDVYLNETADIEFGSLDDFKNIRYYDNLSQAIINRLKTILGELRLHPNYGSRLHELLGTAPDDLTLSVARMHVMEALLQEPRIEEIIYINPQFREGTTDTVIDIDIKVKPIQDLADLNLIYSLFV